VKTDVRKDDPYEIYDELDFEIPVREEGDAYARYLILVKEMEESIKFLKARCMCAMKLPEGKGVFICAVSGVKSPTELRSGARISCI